MRTSHVLAVLVASTVIDAANAAPVLIGTPTDPTGITGLVVGGNTYDVTFSLQSYDALFTGTAPPPIFESDLALAVLAEPALSNFFNSAGITGLGGNSCASLGFPCVVFVPTTPFGDTSNGTLIEFSRPGDWINGAGDPGLNVASPAGPTACFEGGCTYFVEYAVFKPAAVGVPEPAALGLMILSGLGLGFAHRKQVPQTRALTRRSGSTWYGCSMTSSAFPRPKTRRRIGAT